MRVENMTLTIPFPPEVKVTFEDRKLTVTGPQGSLSRELGNLPIEVLVKEAEVDLVCHLARRKEKALMGTYRAHLANMVKGVTEGFEYQLKMVFSHFPVKLSQQGSNIVIENFLGERHPRHARLMGDTKADIRDNLITLTGADKEAVGQSAANMEQATKIKGFDPRVFQDGLYIISRS